VCGLDIINSAFRSRKNIFHRNLAFIDYVVVTEVHSPSLQRSMGNSMLARHNPGAHDIFLSGVTNCAPDLWHDSS
jgi:hypothetical protein